MDEKRYTATNIADLIADALEYEDEAKSNMHHRVRYLAKKGHLQDGRAIDKRGTLDFPASEVYRAAIYCEFLGLTMDIVAASTALRRAEDFRPIFDKPESARVEGGWRFNGGLASAVRGVSAGEHWKLFVVLKRSGHSTGAGLSAFYTWSEEQIENVDKIFGRETAATSVVIDLSELFKKLVQEIGLT